MLHHFIVRSSPEIYFAYKSNLAWFNEEHVFRLVALSQDYSICGVFLMFAAFGKIEQFSFFYVFEQLQLFEEFYCALDLVYLGWLEVKWGGILLSELVRKFSCWARSGRIPSLLLLKLFL